MTSLAPGLILVIARFRFLTKVNEAIFILSSVGLSFTIHCLDLVGLAPLLEYLVVVFIVP